VCLGGSGDKLFCRLSLQPVFISGDRDAGSGTSSAENFRMLSDLRQSSPRFMAAFGGALLGIEPPKPALSGPLTR
jgi:hypothetical protein